MRFNSSTYQKGKIIRKKYHDNIYKKGARKLHYGRAKVTEAEVMMKRFRPSVLINKTYKLDSS